jgi:hypothetical protein
MKTREIIREAWLNFTTGTSRALFSLLLLTVVIAGGVYFESSTVVGIINDAIEYRDSGASINQIEGPNSVDGSVCNELMNVDGINSSGAIKNTGDNITAVTLPQGSIPLNIVTDNFESLLKFNDYKADVPGVLISQTVADRLGVHAGETFPYYTELSATGPSAKEKRTIGEISVRGIYDYPDDGRQGNLGYAVLEPTTDYKELFDFCWVDIWPQNKTLTAMLYKTVAPAPSANGESEPPKVSQINGKFGESFDAEIKFDLRISKQIPLIVLLLTIIIGFVPIRIRRLELASALHSGISKWAMLRLLLFETIPVLFISTLIAIFAYLFSIHWIAEVDKSSLLFLTIRIIVCGIIGTATGTTIGSLLTKEKQLFKYFKER